MDPNSRSLFFASGPVSSDPYFSSVTLLAHMNGTNGSTTFTDSSLSNQTMTAQGDAQITTNAFNFGGASATFDGSGDRVVVSPSTSLSLTGDFTVETWVLFYSLPSFYGHIAGRGDGTNASSEWMLAYYDTGNGHKPYWNGGVAFQGTSTISTFTWHHYAVTRSSGTIRLFWNGVQEGSGTSTASLNTTAAMTIGDRAAGSPNSQYPISGLIDDLRVTNGVARYTSNFTPPTTQFPDF